MGIYRRAEGGWRVRLGRRFTGATPSRKDFASVKTARSWIEEQKRSREAMVAVDLTPGQIAQAKAAYERLGDVPLEKVVTFYLSHAASAGGNKTLDEIVEEYLLSKRRKNRSPKYINAQRIAMNVLARDFGRRPVTYLTSARMEKWFDQKGWNAQNCHNYHRDYRMLFRFATRKEYLARNPMEKLDRPEVDRETPPIYTPEEAGKLLTTTLENPGLGLLGWVSVGLFAGLRVEELKRIRWSAFDLRGWVIKVVKGVVKRTTQPRNVEIGENLRAWLGHVRPAPEGGLVSPIDLRGRLDRLHLLAGVPKRKNALRHSFGSYYYVHTRDAELTRYQLGQRSPDVLFKHYIQLVSQEEAARYWSLLPPRPGVDARPGHA